MDTSLDLAPEALLDAARGGLSGFRRQISPQILDELAQEAMLRLWSADAVHQPRAFVRRVARNLAVDHLRHAREIPSFDLPETASSEDVVIPIDAARVRDLLEQAPEPYRRVIRALVLEDRAVDDLVSEELRARALDPKDDTARRRVRDLLYKHRARGFAWLRDALERPTVARTFGEAVDVDSGGRPVGVHRPCVLRQSDTAKTIPLPPPEAAMERDRTALVEETHDEHTLGPVAPDVCPLEPVPSASVQLRSIEPGDDRQVALDACGEPGDVDADLVHAAVFPRCLHEESSLLLRVGGARSAFRARPPRESCVCGKRNIWNFADPRRTPSLRSPPRRDEPARARGSPGPGAFSPDPDVDALVAPRSHRRWPDHAAVPPRSGLR